MVPAFGYLPEKDKSDPSEHVFVGLISLHLVQRIENLASLQEIWHDLDQVNQYKPRVFLFLSAC